MWNGLTDEWHPTQSLCDMFTMREASGLDDHDITFAYVGDARFNVGCSLLVGGALLGMDVRLVAPPELLPPDRGGAHARRRSRRRPGPGSPSPRTWPAVEGCHFIHTDIWVSMGEPESVWTERILLLRDYQVNTALLERTGVPRREVHALPARVPQPRDHGRRGGLPALRPAPNSR